jgi:hypothetical protein
MTKFHWLEDQINSGALVHPYSTQGKIAVNAIDLYSNLHRYLQDKPMDRFQSYAPKNKGLSFFLVDGNGMHLQNYWPESGFFKKYFAQELHSVFPSTTACALSALATGSPVSQNGITGWTSYIEEIAQHVNILPFFEAFNREEVREYSVLDIVGKKSSWSAAKRKVFIISPAPFEGGAYNTWWHEDVDALFYEEPEEVPAMMLELEKEHPHSFIYTYLPQLDHEQHHSGVYAPESIESLERLDRIISEYAKKAKHVIWATADHGQIEIAEGRTETIDDNDPMFEYLVVPPSGEAVLPIFHVKKDANTDFLKFMEERFGGEFQLFSPDELESLGIFGPTGLSTHTRLRFGDFLGIASDPIALHYDAPGAQPYRLKGYHGGMRRDEIKIPFFSSWNP